METHHSIVIGDAREMNTVADEQVHLVVTSPPYPMIDMWDDVFADLNPEVTERLEAGAGQDAFEMMHAELDVVWDEVDRVLTPGGIVCVVVGDATRSLDGSFRVYNNHVRIVQSFIERGFEPLPDILWRKPVNSAAKFMGSGMLPPNAYVTLEHEFVLVFRKGGVGRSFEPSSKRRYRSAFFWEERNEWFSDLWSDITGARQQLYEAELRDRSAAFPLEVPYRLINMYSVYGDTVLDPFWGLGTTTIASMIAGRNSVGYEIEPGFKTVFDDRVEDIEALSRSVIDQRLESHRRFIQGRIASGKPPEHESVHYDFPVMTRQETKLQFYAVNQVEALDSGYRVRHVPYGSD